jgi:hypothetical protein
MSSQADRTTSPAGVEKQAPTEQQESKPGIPKRFAPGQTVCNEKNEKGKLCNGHLKEVNTQHPSRAFLRGDDTLHRCQACGALYMGPPMGHVRDPSKQTRYVERDLAAILRAAGGTLPAYEYPTPAWRGEPKPKRIAAARPAATPAPPAKPAAAKPAADSSASADAHRPAAEAQAATGQASAAPMSPTAATASPAAGAETASDLAPGASTELTPGAPKDERPKSEAAAPAAPAADAKPKKKGGGGFKSGPEFRPQPGETQEQKIARLKRLVEEAKRAAGKL